MKKDSKYPRRTARHEMCQITIEQVKHLLEATQEHALNERGIETYVRPARSLTLAEQDTIAHHSLHDPRCKKLREARRAASYTQLSWAST